MRSSGMNIRNRIDHTSTLLTGMVIGAAAMYIFDAQQGRRRRALVRDKMIHGLHLMGRWANTRSRDIGNRFIGQFAELRSNMRDKRGIDDEILVERVRAQLGHVVSHPGALSITASEGVVTVRGPILVGEEQRISERLRKTRGVRNVNLRVESHRSEENIPRLQDKPRFQRREQVGGAKTATPKSA